MDRISRERGSQHVATAFIASGLIFMLLPGTFLGVWNLISISDSRTSGSPSPAWLQAHGHAQIFGWVGSFILGIGFYSLTKMQSTLRFPVRAGWTAWTLWILGVALRWSAGVTFWHWRALLPLSAVLELMAFMLFASSVRRHRSEQASAPFDTWMKIVIAATVGFFVTLLVNLGAVVYVALYAATPAIPHVLDEQIVLLALWGMLVPTIWGFNARWLPIFAGLRKPDGRLLLIAYMLSVAGIAAVFLNCLSVAAALLLIAALLSAHALHIWDPPVQAAKLLNIHSSFLKFIRLAYAWLILSCLLFALAITYDHSGGIWGASRHALTVGFIAGMVFAIAPRIVPAFCGMRILWSARLMFWSLLLLHAGCVLRVVTEPLAYESNLAIAWKLLPISAFIELGAVALFGLNIGVTLLRPPAHLRNRVVAR